MLVWLELWKPVKDQGKIWRIPNYISDSQNISRRIYLLSSDDLPVLKRRLKDWYEVGNAS